MSSEDKEPGVVINTRSISFYLSLLTLATIIYTGVSTINAYGYSLEKIQTDQTELSLAVSELRQSVSEFSKNITNFTIVLNRLEDRSEQFSDRLEDLETSRKR